MQYIITKEQIEEVVFLVAEHGRLSALSIKGLLQSLPILGGELWKPPLGTNPSPLFTRIDQLQAEVEALRKDAARYQWLRSRVPGGTYRVMGIIYSEGGEGVDAGIDAAIANDTQISALGEMVKLSQEMGFYEPPIEGEAT
jgi:hypothetical protein